MLLFLSLCFYTVAGYPSKWITATSKDLMTVSTSTANPMATSETFVSGASGKCEIETWTTPAKFKASTKYEIKVKASTASALILQASKGTWEATSSELTSGNKISNTKSSEKVSSHTFLWTSPATGSVEFRAVCISGYGKTGYVAEAVTSTEDPNAVAPVIAATPAPAPAPAAPAAPAASSVGTVLKEGLLTVVGIVSADKATVDFTLTSTRNAWVGFGVGDGMVGSDVVICEKGSSAKRYNIKAKSKPTGGVDVAGSSCTFSNDGLVMKFSRNVKAAGSSESALTPGTKQSLVWAVGEKGDTALAYHAERSTVSLDVGAIANGGTVETILKDVKWTLWLHIICMGSAWGLLLPWGVSIANRTRSVQKDEKPGAWFWLHKNLQYTGWFLQLLGFIFVVVYVSNNSAHFTSPHTWIGLVVVILGTLQPLNAFFRPHNPPAGEEKSNKRKYWEYLHKGSGWTAVVLGAINVIIGALLTNLNGYVVAPMIVGLIFGILGITTTIGFCIMPPDNMCSRFCIGFAPAPKEIVIDNPTA